MEHALGNPNAQFTLLEYGSYDCPFCQSAHEVVSNLHRVANEQSHDTQRRAGRLHADLQYGRIDEILATGLHAYLTQFLERVNALGAGISRDFLVPVAA